MTIPRACVPGLVDGNSHRLRTLEDAERIAAVYRGGRWALLENRKGSIRVEITLLVLIDINSEHVRYSMSLHTTKIGVDQDVGALLRVIFRNAQGRED